MKNLETVWGESGSSCVSWREAYPVMYSLRDPIQHTIYCNFEKKTPQNKKQTETTKHKKTNTPPPPKNPHKPTK